MICSYLENSSMVRNLMNNGKRLDFHGRIVLIMVFAKNEMENLSKAERNNLKMLIARLEKSMEKVN